MKKPDKEKIFRISDEREFCDAAIEIFRYQAANCQVYSEFLKYLGKAGDEITRVGEIPFLPVEFFKTHKVVTGNSVPVKVFESSGTTGANTSRHYVADISMYERSFRESFRLFYGEPSDYIIAALLPSYAEHENSSLVYMMADLINRSGSEAGGFFINDTEKLLSGINEWKKGPKKVFLLGVSFALLDLAEDKAPDLSGIIVMETGGMKGRRKELTRSELHGILRDKFNISSVHSEYGMTELLSQAYSSGNGVFNCPPWMRIMVRDTQDPLSLIKEPGKTGGVNIIDLANIDSCSFIATADLGKVYTDHSFEIIGRFDNSDIRGCNLMID
jgi:hypothetical protein